MTFPSPSQQQGLADPMSLLLRILLSVAVRNNGSDKQIKLTINDILVYFSLTKFSPSLNTYFLGKSLRMGCLGCKHDDGDLLRQTDEGKPFWLRRTPDAPYTTYQSYLMYKANLCSQIAVFPKFSHSYLTSQDLPHVNCQYYDFLCIMYQQYYDLLNIFFKLTFIQISTIVSFYARISIKSWVFVLAIWNRLGSAPMDIFISIFMDLL